MERQYRELKEQQKLHETIKYISDIAQKQLQKAQTEGDKLKQLMLPLQTAAVQMISEISAVKTSVQKLNELSTHDKDWLIPAHHIARNNTISEESMHRTEEQTSEANRQKTGSDHHTNLTTPDSQQNQFIKGHQLETTNTTTYQHTMVKRRTKSESAGTRNEATRSYRTASDTQRPKQVDIVHDPQLQSVLKKRWEQVEATSGNQ